MRQIDQTAKTLLAGAQRVFRQLARGDLDAERHHTAVRQHLVVDHQPAAILAAALDRPFGPAPHRDAFGEPCFFPSACIRKHAQPDAGAQMITIVAAGSAIFRHRRVEFEKAPVRQNDAIVGIGEGDELSQMLQTVAQALIGDVGRFLGLPARRHVGHPRQGQAIGRTLIAHMDPAAIERAQFFFLIALTVHGDAVADLPLEQLRVSRQRP